MEDHRASYTPLQLYVNSSRMVGDYDAEDALADYLTLHPEADQAKIRAELERELQRIGVAWPG